MEHNVSLNTDEIVGRQELVRFLYQTFASETPGNDTEVSRYTYYVENLSDGSRIYLRRPAPLNNGIDFTVNAENYRFPVGSKKIRKHNPSHENIFNMLQEKREENQFLYDMNVKPMIQRIFNVESIANTAYLIQGFSASPYPIELILKLLKWLFAEQDATYWNHSGRNMLMNGLRDNNLA